MRFASGFPFLSSATAAGAALQDTYDGLLASVAAPPAPPKPPAPPAPSPYPSQQTSNSPA